jgi:hypothetical protein
VPLKQAVAIASTNPPLVRCVCGGAYFAQMKIKGKLIREIGDTDVSWE